MELETKKQFTDLLMSVIEPLTGRYSKNRANLRLGGSGAWYPAKTAEMEGFARPLWGLVPFWAGGGSSEAFDDIYINGIKAGCDPDNAEYWGQCYAYDQRFVEMAAIGFGLLFAKDKLWAPLSELERDELTDWLLQINDHDMPGCNWLFFRIIVNIALKKLGRPYDADKTQQALDTIESYYKGDGWYSDGIPEQYDYYISFAIHFYSLIYAVVMGDEDKERSELFKSRAERFAQDFIYWFSADGAAVPYGRSMTYRFAQTAFWGACVLADVRPFPMGVIKGIISRNLSYWFENDDIFDNGHILTIGYKYNQPSMGENYNAPGSPYWALKAFVVLALPDDDGFWAVRSEPIPSKERVKRLDMPHMIAARYGNSSVIYPGGAMRDKNCGHTRYKYLKFGYSSQFGFSIPKSSWTFFENAPDSMLAFEIDERIFTRIRTAEMETADNEIRISWSPFIGIDVKTRIIVTETGHIRQHTIRSDYDCIAYDSGYAVSCVDGCERIEGEDHAQAKNAYSVCRVRSEGGKCLVMGTAPNTNIISPNTVIPTARYKINRGITTIETEIITELL